MMITERELTAERLAAELIALCAGRGRLLAMAERARALANRAARTWPMPASPLAIARREADDGAGSLRPEPGGIGPRRRTAHAPHRHHPFRRHRRRRHGRHRRGAAEPRLQGAGLGPEANAITARLAQLGARIHFGHAAEHVEGADVVVVSSAVRAGQPRGAGGTRAARAGGAARRDARRADALQPVDRGRRHARQDHDHEPDRQRAGRGRDGSDLRDRRPAQERRHQRHGSAPGAIWWPRPTRATPRSCTCSR